MTIVQCKDALAPNLPIAVLDFRIFPSETQPSFYQKSYCRYQLKVYERSPLLQQNVDNLLNVHSLQISIRLARSNKQDGLPCRIRHGQGSANFVIDSVEFGQNHAVNLPWFMHTRKVLESSIEFSQLIHGFIANKSFSHKDDFVWIIHGYQL